ncbi:hypothetical protein XA68_16375 [Ophiocordyceps unilateralis]|uniref:Cyclin-like F-box n=1 Tax=Ophiocordyceps unilateralis TaxID=268505 RepID=A0A2A9PJT0_OPHUN|nr:hypothetical protein XA68_16375 [Ophiocordyceps unilateralis]
MYKLGFLSLFFALAVAFLSLAAAAPQNNRGGVNTLIQRAVNDSGGRNGNQKQGGGNNNNSNSRGGGGGKGGNRAAANNGKGGRQTPRQKATAQNPEGISTAQDGSTIVDQTVQINGLPMRFKVSAPAELFTQNSGVQGAQATPGQKGQFGMNCNMHGDGGQTFFEFPNEGVRDNLIGCAILTPDENLKWGGSGNDRPQGSEHAQAVSDLIKNVMPQMLAFDPNNMAFTGVSGGSLVISGFLMPEQMGNFPNSKVLLNCGGMAPPGQFNQAALAAMANTRIHFQSTTNELNSLQQSIPDAIRAYEQAAQKAGVNQQQLGQLQTVNNSPQGGHCEFDGKGFNSGIQLMADNFANVMFDGGSGEVSGIGNVRQSVVGNEKLRFGPGK